jgi:phosphate transport system permease protein
MLCFVIVNLVVHTGPVFRQPSYDVNHDGIINNKDYVGLKGIFSTKISTALTGNKGQYGLIPAIWGTILLVIVAMGIATPVALLMAIFSSEFTLGFLGRGMRTLLGVLSGIPPIIYALMWIVIFTAIIAPNFRPDGLNPPAGMTWWFSPPPNSTLIGGIMLSLLIIPFLAPLFDDAIKNVPNSFKEASLGLGATRWYTLINVTLPAAFSGLLSGLRLGVLKAMGDVIIVTATIAVETNIPNPFFDILRPIAPLTATGVGLAGGFSQSMIDPLGYAVANVAAILLVIMAFAIIILETLLQRKFKKRFSHDGR